MDDQGPALQDILKVQCFGCGTLNERGLQIKSHWDGDELVCRWQPPPHFIGHPGVVYGGTIASVVDCHGIWTAMASYCRREGIPFDAHVKLPAFVTARLTVTYARPADIAAPLELRAREIDCSERRSTVACRVLQGAIECASAEVVAVRMKER